MIPPPYSPESLVKQQERRVAEQKSLNEPDNPKSPTIDIDNVSIDDMKSIALKNKAKALVLVDTLLGELLESDKLSPLEIADIRDLVNINDTVAKSLVNTSPDDNSLQVVIQQMFQSYKNTPPATPISEDESVLDISKALYGKD